MSIDPIRSSIGSMGGIGRLEPLAPKPPQPAGNSFGQTLSDLVKDVNGAQLKADAAVQDLAEGKTDSLHEVMLAMGKAELSFKFLMQTRNKLVEAYNEIMRLQV
jgi:flagellar hook-basal body complex protein FliE